MTFYLTIFIVCCHAGILVVFLSNIFYLRRKRYRKSNPDAAVKNLFVSILIPARNEAENLRRLIPSILSQSHESFEIIVYDDASEDDTSQVVQDFADPRIQLLRGSGPPEGWAGKVNALYQAASRAKGNAYLFLDADVLLTGNNALSRICACFQHMPAQSVLTAMPAYCGKGLLLVSLVANSLLAAIPWWLVRYLPFSSLSALNGQCWMIDAEIYKRFQPHAEVANAVLEDVMIGRYLKKQGIIPELIDLQEEVAVFMYHTFSDAWQGFRKNVYLLMGGRPISFMLFFIFFALIFVIPAFVDPALLLPVFFNKFLSDQRSGFSPAISVITPLCYLLGSTLQVDSAMSHFTGKVAWKGRAVAAI